VVHGAPNIDLNAGMLLALASNTASYVSHTHLRDLAQFATGSARPIVTADGRRIALPDPRALEDAVDRVLMSWPPGSFDSVGDFVNNPTQTPDSFTWGDHPFNWSGGFMAGPFNGLSVQSNNVHSLNSDPFTQAAQVEPQFGIDRELYLAILLQNAANPEFRWDPESGELPSAFFARVDPSERPDGQHDAAAADLSRGLARRAARPLGHGAGRAGLAAHQRHGGLAEHASSAGAALRGRRGDAAARARRFRTGGLRRVPRWAVPL